MPKKQQKKSPVLNLEQSLELEDLLEEYGVIFEPSSSEEIKRPTKVRIFGRNYAFNYVPEFMGLQECGTIDNHHLLINIKEHQLPIEEADTVLHEVFHGIDYTMDLKLNEHQIRALATGLMGVFQDNPKFAKYVTQLRGSSVSN